MYILRVCEYYGFTKKLELRIQSLIISLFNLGVELWHSIGMNSRATQLKFWCPRISHYASHYHYGSQSIAFSGQ